MFEETGHNSMLARVQAAQYLLEVIMDSLEWWDKNREGEKEFKFVMNMDEKLNGSGPAEGVEISAKQYFWLKDIYDGLL